MKWTAQQWREASANEPLTQSQMVEIGTVDLQLWQRDNSRSCPLRSLLQWLNIGSRINIYACEACMTFNCLPAKDFLLNKAASNATLLAGGHEKKTPKLSYCSVIYPRLNCKVRQGAAGEKRLRERPARSKLTHRTIFSQTTR